MNKSQRIEEIKSILHDIESHIVESSGYYIVSTDIEDGEWGVAIDQDFNDDDELVDVFVASNAMDSEKFESKEEAIKWLVESIDDELSNELFELEMDAKALEAIKDETITITSINPQDSGWYAVIELPTGDNIYDQTARVNAKTVTAQIAYDVYNISVEALADICHELEIQRELSAIMTPAEIEKEFGLSDGTVRQAIYHNYFTRFRKADERTILIRRVDAEARWKHNRTNESK